MKISTNFHRRTNNRHKVFKKWSHSEHNIVTNCTAIIKADKMRMQEDNTLIEVTGLVKKYGNHVAVDHLSFRLEPGKIYGFLGPNGAGKSTTMNMMTGYIGPTEVPF